MPLIDEPITMALNAAGDDIEVPLRFLTGVAAVVQGIKVRLNMGRGEWFLNRDFGIPYLPNDIVPESDAILGQKFNELKVRAAFRSMILSCPGVESLRSLAVKFTGSTRTLLVEFVVRTAFGDSDVEEVVI